MGFFDSDPAKLIVLLFGLGGGLPIVFVLSGYIARVDEGTSNQGGSGGRDEGGEEGQDEDEECGSNGYAERATLVKKNEDRARMSVVASATPTVTLPAYGSCDTGDFVTAAQEHGRLLSAFVMIFVLALIIFVVSLFKAFDPNVFTPGVNAAIAICFTLYVLSFVSVGLPLGCWDAAPAMFGVDGHGGSVPSAGASRGDEYEKIDAARGSGDHTIEHENSGGDCSDEFDSASEDVPSMTLLEAAQTKECKSRSVGRRLQIESQR